MRLPGFDGTFQSIRAALPREQARKVSDGSVQARSPGPITDVTVWSDQVDRLASDAEEGERVAGRIMKDGIGAGIRQMLDREKSAIPFFELEYRCPIPGGFAAAEQQVEPESTELAVQPGRAAASNYRRIREPIAGAWTVLQFGLALLDDGAGSVADPKL